MFSVRTEDPEILSLVATEIMAFLKYMEEVAMSSANATNDSLETDENIGVLTGS